MQPQSPFSAAQRFQPLEFIGRGSMGSVYRVHDAELDTVVAAKTLHALGAEEIYRLKSEFRALAGVTHTNLVQLYELFVDDTSCFFTMEYVDGVDFIEHVRGDRGDLDNDGIVRRLTVAAAQLVRGLDAVHAAGRLHRDVKPSNIRVARDGRVVLLDFDLAAPLGDDAARESFASASVAGTFAYMAPEQMWGQQLGPGTDLYAVGAVLFEALTGLLPFDGPAPQLAMRKSHERPPRPRTGRDDVPEWLGDLVTALLDPELSRRPTSAEVLDRLHAEAPAASSRVRRESSASFVGRESELKLLRAAVDDTVARGAATVVTVHGQSGIGKSELMRQFLASLDDQPVRVLRGRCHPQESVPYKALDPIIDGVSRFLVAQSDEAVRAYLPRYTAALARLFPVLSRVPAVSAATRRREDIDAAELRRRGFAAFRELISRIADARPLVLWIDDLQWGDVDSAALIAELLRPPDLPRIALLLSFRAEDRHDTPLLAALTKLAAEAGGPGLRDVEVGPLPERDARELALRLCPAEIQTAETASRLAAQSGGSPFLLTAMSWHVSATSNLERELSDFDLHGALRARLDGLHTEARRIVELVAVAGGPLERSVVLRAAREGEAGRPLVSRLESELFLRATTVGDRPGVEAYHDRIRESVIADLDAPTLSGCHNDLALAFEASGRAEPEVLAHHFHGAGVVAKAADYAVAAADKAADSLAFVRAAELYRQAREWDPRDGAWRRSLLTREGEACSNAARFEDASRLFLAAVPNAPRTQALDLRRLAAEQLLASGRFDDGVALLSELLRDLGLRYPRTPQLAALAAFARLMHLSCRRIGLVSTRHGPSVEELLRVDTCYSAGKCLVNADSMRGVYFSVEALHHALRIGEPIRVGCSLAVVGGSISVVEGPLLARLGERMMRTAEAIGETTQSPLLLGTIDVAFGQVLLLRGRWRESLERITRGSQTLVERCRGVTYESIAARRVALRALEELGDLKALERLGWELLRSSVELGDRYSEVGAAQQLATALLARDDGDRARALAGTRLENWTAQGFHLQHFYALRQQASCDLYEGASTRSLQTLDTMWAPLRHSGLMRVSLPRIDAYDLRGRLALATSTEGPVAPAVLQTVVACARRLRRETQDHAQARAHVLEAAIARRAGRREAAVRLLETARAFSKRASMPLHAAVADFRRGEVLAGDEGAALVHDASEKMCGLGVARPDRWAAIYAPGIW